MRILNSGAAGGLGAPLANLLHESGHELALVDNLSNGYLENLSRFDLEHLLIQTDISDYDQTASLFEKFLPQVVLNLAAVSSLADCQENPTKAYKSNVLGTATLLELSRSVGVGRFIQTSTSAVYENANSASRIMFDEPHLIYPMSKLESERLVKSYHKVYQLPALILRIFNVLAPYQDIRRSSPPLLNYLIMSYLSGKQPILHSDGTQKRDYVVLEDFLSAFLAAIASPLDSNQDVPVLDICSGNQLSVLEIDHMVRVALKTQLRPIFKPGENFWNAYPIMNSGVYPINKNIVRSEVIKGSLGDNSAALKILNWKPLDTIPELNRIIHETIKVLSN
jgi:nucleoside-diphosphate-sugar epimerase